MTFDEEAVLDPTKMIKNSGLRRGSRILPRQFTVKKEEEKKPKSRDSFDSIDSEKIRAVELIGEGIISNLDTFGNRVSLTSEPNLRKSKPGSMLAVDEIIPELESSA